MADYEELRRRKLEENKKKILELKLSHLSRSLSDSVAKPSPTRTSVKRKELPKDGGSRETVVLRRSGRVASLPQTSYKEVTLDFIGGPRIRRTYKRLLFDRVYASDEARIYAVERAEALQEKLEPQFPSFVKPMLQSHVTGGFWLGLPRSFCIPHLPSRDDTVTLIDEKGDEFSTVYLAQKNGLSGGWRGFSMDHDLVDGDALVFQLVEHSTFKVYIIRQSEYDGA